MKGGVPALQTVADLAAFLEDKHSYDMFKAAPPVDVDKVARLLNIDVDESPDFDAMDTIGRITLERDQRARVWINPFENSYTPRRRFTLAHEIGHYCMHRSTERHEFVDDRSTMSRSESYWNRYESEANSFAAELLMPAPLINTVGRKVIDAYKIENSVEKMPLARFVEAMASRFSVSNPAMEYRLKNMGIGRSK